MKEGKPWLAIGLTHDQRKAIYAEYNDGEERYWTDPEDYRNKPAHEKKRYTTRLRAVNEFEEMLMVHGITRYRFGQIVGIKGSTIKKYIENPEQVRVQHIEMLAEWLGVDAAAIFQLINEDYARVLKNKGEYEKYWNGQQN